MAAAAIAGLLGGACGGGPDGDAAVARDSAGVRIVEMARLPTGPVAWTLDAEPRVVIGGDATDERAQLFRIAGAARRSDSRILVGNGGTSELRLFEADGTPAAAFGRSGGGPGEFGALTLVGLLAGDSALVHDPRHGRFTVVTPGMTLGRTTPITMRGRQVRAFPQGLLRGGPVVANGGARIGASTPTAGVLDPPTPVYLVGLDGAIVDSAGDFPNRPLYLETREGAMQLTRVPFGTETQIAAGPDRFHVGTADAYEILTFDRAGRLVRILRAAEPRRPVTPEDVARRLDNALENAQERNRPAIRRAYEAMPIPERMPAHAALMADALGNLWVEEYPGAGESPPTWTVFDPEGMPLGRVITPEGVRLEEVGADYVLGTGTDELDRPYVALWGLER